MVLGALILRAGAASALRDKLEAVRGQHGLSRELKWGKVSGSMLRAYSAFVQATLEELSAASPGYYCVVIDTQQLDHGRFNGGDREIGFSKFVYQIVSKCAYLFRFNGAVFDVFMDDRTTRQTLTEFKNILNAGMNKKAGVRPFRRVEYRDSKQCNLIQVVDLFTGAVAYQWNERHLAADASKARVALAEAICAGAALPSLARDTSFRRDSFSIWKFATQKGRPNGPRGQ